MTKQKKSPNPDRSIKMLEMILIHQFHEKYINELNEYGVDATQQLEEREIIEDIYKQFLDLDFDQLLRASANLPDSLGVRLASKTTKQEKLFKELRQKYFDRNYTATIH
ncbi:MAG: hypothetical protein AB2809_06995 [Candidatus Thiodiazotropha sp.]